MSNVDIAISLAVHGFYVFPLTRTGKFLQGFSWDREATRSRRQIREWWASDPRQRIGVHCGRSGIVVVDLDRKHGKDGFASLKAAGVTLPRTFNYTSRSGQGEHHIYRAPAGVQLTIDRDLNGMPGVDIRSGIGMIAYNGPELGKRPRLAPAPEWALVHKKDGWDYDMADLEAWLDAEGTATDSKQKARAAKARRKATIFPEDGITEPELLNWVTPLVSGLMWGGGRREAYEAARARYTNDYPDPKYLIHFDRAWAKAITRVEADRQGSRAPIKPKAKRTGKGSGRELVLVDLDDVEEEPIYWALEDVFPLGTLSIMSGLGDVGKSTLLATWAKQIMEGTAEGDLDGPTSILTAVGEDDLGRVLKPRMRAAGYDSSTRRFRVITITSQGHATSLQIQEDLDAIRRAVIDTGARVLILDPVISYVAGDPNKPKDVREAMDPVRDLATELNIAIICILHHKKGQGTAAEKLSGAHAWRDIARSHIFVVKDEETGVRYATVEKGNYTGARLSFSFETEEVVYPNPTGRGKPIKTARVINLQRSTVTAHEVLNKQSELVSTNSELRQAIVHYIDSHRVTLSPSEVAEALGEDVRKVNVYLDRAWKSGQIKKAGRGAYHSLAGVDIKAERAKKGKK
ncbi:bifunctional DNA primase/polymerase [Microbacterium oxydans]|uniref:bifunctional DNA primase/polymerase n=1 Tax=Microbacterium oxydans TaxID=82380 RepID=UPI0022B11AE5|nr:bifunctional DNA primase/polymerase [Microbacterium oxydans]MCZ4301341.1 bifunctional DNA primase/polymerase [Microbacterium oxydans]